jgi:hypothetical protein
MSLMNLIRLAIALKYIIVYSFRDQSSKYRMGEVGVYSNIGWKQIGALEPKALPSLPALWNVCLERFTEADQQWPPTTKNITD